MADTKETYVREAQARLDKLNAQIDELKAQSAQVKADLAVEYNRKLRELDGWREDLSGRLQKMKVAGGDAWQDLKTGTEDALTQLSKAVSSSIARFK